MYLCSDGISSEDVSRQGKLTVPILLVGLFNKVPYLFHAKFESVMTPVMLMPIVLLSPIFVFTKMARKSSGSVL